MSVLTAILLVLLAAAPSRAQSNIATGAIHGALTPAAPAPAAADPPKAVLILSEGPMLPYAAVLREHLTASIRHETAEPLNIYEELIDRIRFDTDDYRDQLLALYKAKYGGAAEPTVVITITEPALDFALRYRNELFPNAALLFGAIDERALRGRDLGANVTGVFSHIDVRGTIERALALHPRTRQVVVVGGTSRLDRRYLDVAHENLRGLESQAAVTFLTDQSLDRVLTAVSALPDDALVLFLSMQSDGNGVARTGPDVLAALRHVAAVPIYGMSGNFLGGGIVGGVLFDMFSHGSDLAKRAGQILNGTRAAELVPMTSQNTVAFDSRELRRFGIDEARLPARATVINRQVGLWEGYRGTILIASGLLVGQGVMIAGLMFQGRRRRRAEVALRHRQEELHRSQSRYTLATAAGAVGVWDWDFETNELFVDPVLKALLGFDEQEISTRPDDWGSRVHPEDLPVAAAGIKNCTDGITDTYEIEHRMVHKDGRVKWMLSRGSAMRAADGRLRRLVGTKVDITERKRAEEAIRENQAVLEASHREIQDLAGRLIRSQDLERARIARDLHDDLSQQIASLSIELSSLKRQVSALPGAGRLPDEVASLQQRTSGLAENIRHLSHDLHPTVLQHAGLVATLAAHCAQLERRQRVVISFIAEGDFASLTPAASLCLYRVAQEALHNVVTHAKAPHAEARLLRISDVAELIVADDGSGFEIEHARANGRGLGLVSINERVRLAGGTVSIVTELNKGTRIRVRIPANGHHGHASPG